MAPGRAGRLPFCGPPRRAAPTGPGSKSGVGAALRGGGPQNGNRPPLHPNRGSVGAPGLDLTAIQWGTSHEGSRPVSRFWTHFVTNGGTTAPDDLPPPDRRRARRARRFRRVVVDVADNLRPAVVNLRVGRGTAAGGSGVLFAPDGFLLTNHHVVQRQRRACGCGSPTARELPGRVVGNDPWTDLAVVQAERRRAAVSPRSATRRRCRSGNSSSPSAARWGSSRR